MPKRPNKQHDIPQPNSRSTNQPNELLSVWEQTKLFLKSDNFRIISGVVLLGVTLYLLIAYISYFFTGAVDSSAFDNPEAKLQIQNAAGSLGAKITEFFINQVFGISYLALLVMNVLYGLHLLHIYRIKPLRTLFISLFFLIWGSLMLGYLDTVLPIDVFFRLGGRHGEIIIAWLCANISWIGTLILLLVALFIFCLVTSDNTIPVLKRFGAWIVSLFHKKKSEDAPDESRPDIQVSPDDDGKIIIDFPVEITKDTPQPADDQPKTKDDGPDLIFATPEIGEPSEPSEPSEPLEHSEPSEPSEPPASGDDLQIQDPTVVEMLEEDPDYILKTQGPYDPRADLSQFRFPSLDLLKEYPNEDKPVIDEEEQRANARRIVTTLNNYGVEIETIKATVGPTVTLYEIVPKAGVRVSKVQALENDIMLSLSAMGIRIIAPMPGKGTIGIEVPNEKPQIVSMHSLIASKRFQEEQKMRLPIAYGRTITNDVFMFDLAKTPHLLVAGATGTGKSVAINAIITSLLYKKHPAEMKLVLVDPKMVEFAPYKPLLKHYLAATPDTDPDQVVITDCDKVVNTLNSLVIEMENRYKLLMDAGVRNLEDYNEKFISRRLNPNKLVADSLHHQYLPYIVIIIDEYGDFIMQAGKQVETPIARITQKARAVGMHMILATQRPSVNIVTGVIKANIPTRIALRTQSVVDSRTVLDAKGAEQLIGRGDSLYAGNASITRVQCAFVDTPEVDDIVEHDSHQQSYRGPYELPEYIGEGGEGEALTPGSVDLRKLDPMFRDIATYVVSSGQGSTSIIQRKFQIGYNRAGKISDQLEAAGIVGPNKGPKGRDVLIQDDMSLQLKFKELGI